MGKWKTEPGGGNRGQTTVRLSRGGDLGTSHASCPRTARTKPLQEGKKALRDNEDPMLGLGLAQILPPSGADKTFSRWELGSFTPNSVAPGRIRPHQRDLSLQERRNFTLPSPGDRQRRRDGATHEAKCCHGAPVPALARSSGAAPRAGGSGAFSELPLTVTHQTRRSFKAPSDFPPVLGGDCLFPRVLPAWGN